MSHVSYEYSIRLFAALGLTALAAGAQAQSVPDTEPNDTCVTAQVVGAAAVPVTVIGSLDSGGPVADIDFYRFSRPAGEFVQVDHEGASTGQGSLNDPLVGLFDSQCNALTIDDDGGVGLNSRLRFSVPDDGEFVIGATAFPDFSFVGGGFGSYRLTVDRVREIDFIEGRIVDAVTGQALPGFDFPFASASLLSCDLFGCNNFVAFVQAGFDGVFRFDATTIGFGLSAGTYQVLTSAFGYFEARSEPFTAGEDEGVQLGDIAMEPLSFIGSISGRVVDAVSGAALPGIAPPFSIVELQRCEVFGCVGLVSFQPDFDGNFFIEGPPYQLIPGDYRVIVRAEDYLATESATLTIGTNEHVEFGNVAVDPLPIGFDVITPCVISPRGLCQFDVHLTNRSGRSFGAALWSIVEYYGATSPPVFTRFQIGSKGISDPAPQRFWLAPGETRPFRFAFWVPASVPPGSTVCASVAVGELPTGVFAPISDRFAFCATKDASAAQTVDGLKGPALRRALRERHGLKD